VETGTSSILEHPIDPYLFMMATALTKDTDLPHTSEWDEERCQAALSQLEELQQDVSFTCKTI